MAGPETHGMYTQEVGHASSNISWSQRKVQPIQPRHLCINIKYSNVRIDIDKLWFPEPFYQLPNTLCGCYNQNKCYIMYTSHERGKALHNNDTNFRHHVLLCNHTQ